VTKKKDDALRQRRTTGHGNAGDWNLLKRLYERSLIGDPVNKTKSVIFAEKGSPAGTIHLSLNENIVKAATAITSVADQSPMRKRAGIKRNRITPLIGTNS
jgi:hypothetical protein